MHSITPTTSAKCKSQLIIPNDEKTWKLIESKTSEYVSPYLGIFMGVVGKAINETSEEMRCVYFMMTETRGEDNVRLL